MENYKIAFEVVDQVEFHLGEFCVINVESEVVLICGDGLQKVCTFDKISMNDLLKMFRVSLTMVFICTGNSSAFEAT